MKLEITKEKVLEAASKCSEAKEILKTLFPEVFEEERPMFKKDVGIGDYLANDKNGNGVIKIGSGMNTFGYIEGEYFFLDMSYKWEIERGQFLIPTKK
jgi:hypothetical protein